jgi:hypothetical protein
LASRHGYAALRKAGFPSSVHAADLDRSLASKALRPKRQRMHQKERRGEKNSKKIKGHSSESKGKCARPHRFGCAVASSKSMYACTVLVLLHYRSCLGGHSVTHWHCSRTTISQESRKKNIPRLDDLFLDRMYVDDFRFGIKK